MYTACHSKWDQLGIIEAILVSRCETPFNQPLLAAFLPFWSLMTNLFHLLEGNMTITITDIFHLLNLPADGEIIYLGMVEKARSEFVCSSNRVSLAYTTFLA